jgi:ribonuclease III
MQASSLANMSPLQPVINLFRTVFGSKKEKPSDESLERLQDILGYRFRSLDILRLALTHKSSIAPDDTKGLLSNERLEFLGDSVLNVLVTEHLYCSHPDKTEGQLSKVKSLIVSRKILGEIAISFDLGKYLIFGISEEKSGGRNRHSILSNAFEAVLGAIYIDGGLTASKEMLEHFLFGRINEFVTDERNVNYKSKILEISQRDGFGIPRYVTISAIGPDHAKEFRIRIDIAGVPLGEGTGSNKKVAQQNAAQIATMNYNKDEILACIKGENANELVSE